MNKYTFNSSVLILNLANSTGYNLHKQNLFGVLDKEYKDQKVWESLS